jgi:vitamin B12 transporter
MINKLHVSIALCLVTFTTSTSQTISQQAIDEVVVSDSRFELKRENSGKTVIKISRQEIENNQGRTVSALINSKSGIQINGSRSNSGQNLGVYVRGGRNRQVLVLIDGIQVNDPSQLSGDYDFRLLNLNQIESIEITKGAASTLYGSGAASAVISITTKTANANKISTVISSSTGTNQTEADQNYDLADFTNSVAFSGTLNKFTYRTAFNQHFSDGLSAAISDINEKDTFSKQGVDINFGYSFNEAFSLNIFGNITETNSEIDGFDSNFNLADTPDEFNSKQSRIGVLSTFKYLKGSVRLIAAYSEYDREFISSFPSTYNAKNFILDIHNKYVLDDAFYTVIGLNTIESKAIFSSEQSFSIVDPYVNLVYVSDFGLNINSGVRLNNHSDYGSHFIYNLNPSFTIKHTNNGYVKLFGSFSTSYITPSLSHLYGDFGANPSLSPEENRTIETGTEFTFNKNLRVSGLFFNREEKNTVLWVDGGYQNAADLLHARGVELELNASFLENVSIQTNYTFVEYKEDLARRIPKHKVNFKVGYEITYFTYASLSYQYTHEIFENSFSPLLDSFNLFNLYFSHQPWEKKIKFFGGIDNLLNQKFEEIPGYTTKGRNVRLGFTLTI